MKQNNIYWKDALQLLKNKKKITGKKLEFKNEQVPVKDAIFLNKNGFEIPENLISYNDKAIDCTDINEIKNNDIKSGKIQWMKTDEFPIDIEIRQWLAQQNINLSDLVGQLVKNFYQTMKHVQKNAAV